MLVEQGPQINFQVSPKEENGGMVKYVVRGEKHSNDYWRKSLFLPRISPSEEIVLLEDRGIFPLITKDLYDVTAFVLGCQVSKQHENMLLPRLDESGRDFYKLLVMNFGKFVDFPQAEWWIQRKNNGNGNENGRSPRLELWRLKRNIAEQLAKFNRGQFRLQGDRNEGFRMYSLANSGGIK